MFFFLKLCPFTKRQYILSVLNYMLRVRSCPTSLTWLRALRALRAYMLYVLTFLRVLAALRAFIFLHVFNFLLGYILFIHMLIKFTQINELT